MLPNETDYEIRRRLAGAICGHKIFQTKFVSHEFRTLQKIKLREVGVKAETLSRRKGCGSFSRCLLIVASVGTLAAGGRRDRGDVVVALEASQRRRRLGSDGVGGGVALCYLHIKSGGEERRSSLVEGFRWREQSTDL